MGKCDPATFPIQKKRASREFLRTIAHLRPRTNTFGAVCVCMFVKFVISIVIIFVYYLGKFIVNRWQYPISYLLNNHCNGTNLAGVFLSRIMCCRHACIYYDENVLRYPSL